jgi:hypothetical protein
MDRVCVARVIEASATAISAVDDIQDWCASVPDPRLVVIDTLEKFRSPRKPGVPNYSADY